MIPRLPHLLRQALHREREFRVHPRLVLTSSRTRPTSWWQSKRWQGKQVLQRQGQPLEIRMKFLHLLSIILGRSIQFPGRSIQFATHRSLSSFRMTTTSGVVSTVTGPGIMISRLWTKFYHGMLLTGEGVHIECFSIS